MFHWTRWTSSMLREIRSCWRGTRTRIWTATTDDEVFALKDMPAEEDSDDEGEVMDYDEEEEEEEAIAPTKPKLKKAKKKAKEDESSDEDKEEEEEEAWGRGKAVYYNDNADQLESDDEEGHELEEKEAKRLQSKAREHMTDEDFGLQDVVDVQRDDMDGLLDEPTPVAVPPMPTEPQDIIRHLQKTNPEALALARDWEDTAEDLLHAENKIKEVEAETPNAPKLGLLHFHYQTLLSYASVLAFYIHLRAMPKYAQKPTLLQSHPVMTQLLKLKRALITMEDLGLGVTDDEDEDDEEAFDEENSVLGGAEFLDWLTTGQLSGALDDSEEDEDIASLELPARKKWKKTKEPPKKKRKVQKDSEPAKPIFDLEEPEFVPTKKKSSSRTSADDDVYGEADFLQTADAADKSARKKTLQFHTSRIESASARRQSARNQAMGGDDDIPYRERQKQIALRAEQEAKKRLAQQGGEDLDDVEPELPSRKRIRDGDSDDGSTSEGGDSADEYYELVKKKSKQKKQKKKEEHEAARAEQRIVEDDDASGPRSLTRAILKNRGLTPHRSKAVRNPRVKKRQRYDQAKKKLSSQKAIYKGGVSETKGTYGGEKSGISKVIKSVRLG
ncbi:Sas10 C-terminal domain-containing protein [Coprinopsis sp. MPI-PUGE-AT-0042]|nr:Sas10 C-terminal domain-containing protein [Coprinopsis sp. MPI-PUGE-AT-0042]